MKKRKIFFWGVLVTFLLFLFHFLTHILSGQREFSKGLHGGQGRGFSEMGQAGHFASRGEFPGHHMMGASFHGTWLFLLCGIGLVVLVVLLVNKKRNKNKDASLETFIDSTVFSAQTEIPSKNARILDQWEKEILNKKETK